MRATAGSSSASLLIADKGAYVSYLEGYPAPQRDENQLHAAVVELVIAHEDAQIKYSDRPELVPRRCRGQGRNLQLRHQVWHLLRRIRCMKISRPRSRPARRSTWKYPSCVLEGDDSGRRVLFGGDHQQPPAGRYRDQDDPYRQEHVAVDDHLEGHLAGRGQNTYRGLGRCSRAREGTRATTRNATSLLIGDRCGSAQRCPISRCATLGQGRKHERRLRRSARISLFYCRSRGLSQEDALSLITVNGFCKEVLKELPRWRFPRSRRKSCSPLAFEGSVG